MSDEQSINLFKKHSNMPNLGNNFNLTDYNILLIISESTRFDKTGLSENPRAAQTSNMKKFSASAYNFTKAFSASSGTLESFGALFNMTPSSFAQIHIAHRPWFGKFDEINESIVESFRKSSYYTFRIIHNFSNAQRIDIKGLEQGFDDTKFCRPSPLKKKRCDNRITKRFFKKLKKLKSKKFFGLLFYVSPHAPYTTKKPFKNRYLNEIEVVDTELGKVINSLKSMNLYNKTVIIYTSDHGEEFKEHGGIRHKSTVYSESIHVPLIVHIPNQKNVKIEKPTSIVYIFPWLFLNGNNMMQKNDLEKINKFLGPLLNMTDGSHISEINGNMNMRVTLINGDFKYNHNFYTNRNEFFHIKNDPHEFTDVRKRFNDKYRRFKRYFSNYLNFRACLGKIEISP